VPLPGGPNDLILIDGVTDIAVVRPYLAAQSRCRVLVTSTASTLDPRWQTLRISEWSDQDARRFVSTAAPDLENTNLLTHALGNSPLAISQAVSVCRTRAIGTEEYLGLLEVAPDTILDLGADALSVLPSRPP